MRKLIPAFLLVMGAMFQTLESRAQKVPAKAFPFELKDTLGQIVRLEDFKGKTLIMDFWFTGCKGCVQVAKSLHDEVIPHFRSDTSVVFIAVSIDINFLVWKRSVRSGIYSSAPELDLFTMGMGAEHPLFKHSGFNGCPQLLVIGPDGNVVTSSLPTDLKSLVDMISGAGKSNT